MSWFNHKAAAVEGVGFGHKVLASLGCKWFEVDIIVTKPSGGSIWFPLEDYLIIVRVRLKNGKVYEDSYRATGHGLTHLIKVLGFFKGVKKYFDAVKISVTNNGIKVKEVFAKAIFKRHK
jgi:hypothetical protein